MSNATATHPISDPTLRALAVETDTKLAELDAAYATLAASRSSVLSTVRRLNNERAVYRGRQRTFDTPASESVDNLRAKLAAGDLKPWDVETAERALNTLAQLDEKMQANRLAAEQLEEIWADNGYWSRFFLVLNTNGHIHYDVSNYRCSRQPTTTHGWNPQLSGLTEAEAVAELGPLLCTNCFPSAPVEWTVGKAKPARCAGSGKYVSGTGRRRYVECPECHEIVARTPNGLVRAHKPQPAES